MATALTPSEKALIADMADVLLRQETDLGDERTVEMALYHKDRDRPRSGAAG